MADVVDPELRTLSVPASQWERVVNSLRIDLDCDVVITTPTPGPAPSSQCLSQLKCVAQYATLVG